MRLFNFFRKKKHIDKNLSPIASEEKKAHSRENGFEFLITGEINIPAEDYDQIMTPNTFTCNKVNKDDWTYYQVGEDQFSYSVEEPGIQMTFNREMSFNKAKKIADEIIGNIKATGQEAQLIVLDTTKVYRFD